MGSDGGKDGKVPECPRGWQITARDRKIAFYGFCGVSAFLVILALFAVSYVGSPVPLDLLRLDNFSFSYAGTPTYTYLLSDNFYTGMNGIGGTETSLEAGGGSRLMLYPAGNLSIAYRNGTIATVDDQRLPVALPPDEQAKITIRVGDGDSINYNMRLRYQNPGAMTTNYPLKDIIRDFNRTNTQLQIIRESEKKYDILANYSAGASKTFEVKEDPAITYPIRINFSHMGYNRQGDFLHASDHQREAGPASLASIAYNGSITVSTDNTLNVRSSVSKMSEISCWAIILKNAKGALDIQHLSHESNAADTIAIHKGDRDINASLRCGELIATGSAEELEFRGKEFQRPIWVIIKEGNFALLTGLLSSFATIMLARMVSAVKKKE